MTTKTTTPQTTTAATKGKTLYQPRTGNRYTVIQKTPQCMGWFSKVAEDPTYRVMVTSTQGRAFDLFYNQADLDAGRYVIEN